MATWTVTRAAHFALSFDIGLPSSCSFAQVVVSAARCGVTFISMFFFPPLFGESFAGHIDNTTVPYQKTPKLYFNMIIPYQLLLTLKHVAVRQREYRY